MSSPTVDLQAAGRAGDDDCGVPCGRFLRRYAESVISGTTRAVRTARDAAAAALGPAATADAASVIAFFDGINRIADATGTVQDVNVDAGAKVLLAGTGLDAVGRGRPTPG